ncbi:ribosome assembly RNA-binding protein YhbY [Thiohalorhabdus sp.]|uniref:ribosome assembly RNA-binding protein YhbY n=1 Tax=Thiohalorhabdus sp. TaxID=3094134 RepID=UPI002FC3DC83
MSSALTSKQHRFLRSRAHHLQPVVQVGDAGVSEAVIAAADEALAHHELIKVRFQQGDKAERRVMTESLCAGTAAHLVQEVGRIAILYRPAEDPVIQLSEA